MSLKLPPAFLLRQAQTKHYFVLFRLFTIWCDARAVGIVKLMGWLIWFNRLMSTLATGSVCYWNILKTWRTRTTRIIVCFSNNANKLRIYLPFQIRNNFCISQPWTEVMYVLLNRGTQKRVTKLCSLRLLFTFRNRKNLLFGKNWSQTFYLRFLKKKNLQKCPIYLDWSIFN